MSVVGVYGPAVGVTERIRGRGDGPNRQNWPSRHEVVFSAA